jgi:hypothetical protein
MSNKEKELKKLFNERKDEKSDRNSYSKDKINRDLKNMYKILESEGRFDGSIQNNQRNLQ